MTSRTPAHFKQCDVTRLIKAVVKAGESVRKIEISPDGRIEVYLGAVDDAASADEWDVVLYDKKNPAS